MQPLAGAHARKSVSAIRQQHRVLDVAKGVSATLGLDFFAGMVAHLAKALKGDYVYVAELAAPPVSRMKTLAVSRRGIPGEHFEQDLPGTSALQVLVDGSVAWSKDACHIFPLDTFLEGIKAEGFAGVRLLDSHGQVLGLLALAARGGLKDPQLVKSVLETFAPRAAAELERKRSEDNLRESDQRYRAFISLSSDAMWRIELSTPVPIGAPEDEQIEMIFRFGYVAECNDAMCKLAGVSSTDELIGKPFGSLFSREDVRIREELRAAVRAGFAATTVHTSLLDEAGNKVYRLRTLCGIVEHGKLHRIWGTTRDLTSLRRAEVAAETAEHRFRGVLQGIQIPALMLEKDGTITFSNETLVALAHSTDQLIGKNWLELIASPEERATWASLLSDRSDSADGQHHFESVIHLLGADPRVIAWDTISLRNEHGEPAGLAAIGRDLTEQKALDARLLQAEKLDSIGRLAAGIAHDFNNLLTLLMGNLGVALERLDPELEGFSHVVSAASAADECAQLTRQLLVIGRKQRLKPDLISLNQVIESEKPILAGLTGQEIELVAELDPSLKKIYADPSQVRRILTNLVTNARDAMPEGGRITIRTANLDIQEPGSRQPGIPDGRYVLLSVSDTGTGLSDEVKAHMFDPFFTTKGFGKGTGLGLSTVYGIIAQSGGYIWAQSAPGAGTVIEILLPKP